MTKYLSLVFCVIALTGCANGQIDDGLKELLSDIAENISKDDCDVYTRNTSAHDECMNKVDSFYTDDYE